LRDSQPQRPHGLLDYAYPWLAPARLDVGPPRPADPHHLGKLGLCPASILAGLDYGRDEYGGVTAGGVWFGGHGYSFNESMVRMACLMFLILSCCVDLNFDNSLGSNMTAFILMSKQASVIQPDSSSSSGVPWGISEP